MTGPIPLQSIQFLQGEWQADSSAGEASGGFTFSSQVQGRVMLRRNCADYPPQGERPALHHEDLMVIYEDAELALRADYFDNEGHIIHYSGLSPTTGRVVFISQATAPGPQFRLSYELDPQGSLHGTFEISPPTAGGALLPYLAWTARRIG